MDWSSIQSFMMIGAHCDDVEVRAAGTFARLKREGKRGTYVVAVENPYLKPGHPQAEMSARDALATRRGESKRAAAILEADRVEFLQMQSYYFWTSDRQPVYPQFTDYASTCATFQNVEFSGDGPILNAYTLPTVKERLERLIREEAPDVIFCNAPDDRHQDHYCLARLVDYVVNDLRAEGLTMALSFFEPGTGGPIGVWKPDVLMELSEADVARATEATRVFESQFDEAYIRDYSRDRARVYGDLGGVRYAEAFQRPCGAGGGAWRDAATVRACMEQAAQPPVVVHIE